MANPGLYPQNSDAANTISKQFGGQDVSPAAAASQLAHGYQKALPAGAPGALQAEEQGDPDHMAAMHAAAEAAKAKYMQENGIDENGNPVK